MLLSSRRCPHTGVVNYFSSTDPLFSIGSIARCGTAATDDVGFTWRCYGGEQKSAGHAPDLKTAERRLTSFYALIEHAAPELRRQ